jgi:hypothetical protein
MTDTTSNPIYSYRASEELDTDSWSTLVNAVKGIDSPDMLKQQFKDWENDYRSTTGLPIPNAWRSAKSVIVRASKNSVDITHEDGSVRGKTAVENAIKAAKAGTKVEDDPEQKFDKMLDTLVEYANKHYINWQEHFAQRIGHSF